MRVGSGGVINNLAGDVVTAESVGGTGESGRGGLGVVATSACLVSVVMVLELCFNTIGDESLLSSFLLYLSLQIIGILNSESRLFSTSKKILILFVVAVIVVIVPVARVSGTSSP